MIFSGKKTSDTKTNGGENALKLNVSRTTLIGIAFLSISMFWQVYDTYMPLFLQDFNLSEVKIGIIMALDNLLALILLPVIGFCSDNLPPKLRRKAGRRVPFIVAGSVLAAITFILLNLAYVNHNLALMISLTVLLLLFMNIYRAPAVSLMPDITPKRLRSGANAVINIMGAVGMAAALVVSMAFKKTESVLDENGLPVLNQYNMEVFRLKDGGGNWVIIIFVAVIMIIVAAVFALKVKENRFVEQKNELLAKHNINEDELQPENSAQAAEEKREKVKIKEVLSSLNGGQKRSLFFLLLSVALWYLAYNAVTTWFSTYSFNVLNVKNFELPLLVANVSAFAMFVPAGIIGKKIGRKKTVLLGVGMMIAAFAFATVIQFTASASVMKVAMYPAFVLVGGGWATINVHSFVMSVELASEKTNGVFTGFYYAFAMAAQTATPVLSGWIFRLFGGAPDGFSALLPYALVFSVLAFLTMLPVKHGNARSGNTRNKEE